MLHRLCLEKWVRDSPPIYANFPGLRVIFKFEFSAAIDILCVRGSGSRASPQSRNRKILEELHDAISFSRLSSYCKLIVPVGLPSLRIMITLLRLYHTTCNHILLMMRNLLAGFISP